MARGNSKDLEDRRGLYFYPFVAERVDNELGLVLKRVYSPKEMAPTGWFPINKWKLGELIYERETKWEPPVKQTPLGVPFIAAWKAERVEGKPSYRPGWRGYCKYGQGWTNGKSITSYIPSTYEMYIEDLGPPDWVAPEEKVEKEEPVEQESRPVRPFSYIILESGWPKVSKETDHWGKPASENNASCQRYNLISNLHQREQARLTSQALRTMREVPRCVCHGLNMEIKWEVNGRDGYGAWTCQKK